MNGSNSSTNPAELSQLIDDAIEQSVFENYTALHLKTTRDIGGYSYFENH